MRRDPTTRELAARVVAGGRDPGTCDDGAPGPAEVERRGLAAIAADPTLTPGERMRRTGAPSAGAIPPRRDEDEDEAMRETWDDPAAWTPPFTPETPIGRHGDDLDAMLGDAAYLARLHCWPKGWMTALRRRVEAAGGYREACEVLAEHFTLEGVPGTTPPPLRVGYGRSLAEVLAALGWTHGRPRGDDLAHAAAGAALAGLEAAGKRTIRRGDGSVAGVMDALECWAFLRHVGLIEPAADAGRGR